LNGRGAGFISSRERCCAVRVLAEKTQRDTKTWQYSPCQGQQLPRPAEQTVVTTTNGYGSITTVHVGHIVHKATAVSRVGWAAQKWFSESSGSGPMVLGNQPISVRRHDCQELPPSTCTLDHHGQTSLSMFMYHYEHVVIGPVNHAYAWRATADKLCPTMVLRPHLPAPNRGSRKVVAGCEWFAEPPNNKLGGLLCPCRVLRTEKPANASGKPKNPELGYPGLGFIFAAWQSPCIPQNTKRFESCF
jgi:hypothetical protein